MKSILKDYKYKIELHAHTKPASRCGDIEPEEVVKIYKKIGYDAIAITNHFADYNIYNSDGTKDEKINKYYNDFWRAYEFGEKIGIKVLFGIEIRFSENSNDYLVFGIDKDDLYEMYDYLNTGIEKFYVNCKNNKNVVIQAHPYRKGIERANYKFIDGVEVFNLHPGHNNNIGFSANFAKENDLLITGGTDYHHYGHEGMIATMSKFIPNDSFELAELIKSQDYIFDVFGNKIIM